MLFEVLFCFKVKYSANLIGVLKRFATQSAKKISSGMEIKKYLAVFTGFTLLSRFLGLARDVLIAYKLGATVFSDIFFVAFRLPNLFRSIFAEGALNGAFLPIYAQIKSENGPNCQLKFAYKIHV